MSKKTPRYEVISVRLNEDRLALLERYRNMLAGQLGRTVSIAEAAFLVLEERAVGMDREASRFEMLQTPTASLARIRSRWASEHTLSAPEWDVFAEYVQIGADHERQEPPLLWPAVPSRDSYLALLDAFSIVYEHRTEPVSPHTWEYFGNLGGYETEGILSDEANQRHEDVVNQIDHRKWRLAAGDTTEPPGNIGRCFLTAIRHEGVDSATLDHLLAPYWRVLWGLAARGHWIRHDHQPVRLAGKTDEDLRRRMSLPSAIAVDDLRVSFSPSGGSEFVTQIEFAPARRMGVLIKQYPELVEFRAMLEAVNTPSWSGRYFRVVGSEGETLPTRRLYVKQLEVHVDLSEIEWNALRQVVRQAWQAPELQRWLSVLQQEYGEHG
jgi:hypothetical protein